MIQWTLSPAASRLVDLHFEQERQPCCNRTMTNPMCINSYDLWQKWAANRRSALREKNDLLTCDIEPEPEIERHMQLLPSKRRRSGTRVSHPEVEDNDILCVFSSLWPLDGGAFMANSVVPMVTFHHSRNERVPGEEATFNLSRGQLGSPDATIATINMKTIHLNSNETHIAPSLNANHAHRVR